MDYEQILGSLSLCYSKYVSAPIPSKKFWL